MIDTCYRAVALAAAILGLTALPAHAQDTRLESLQRDTSDFFGQLFGGSDRGERRPAPAQPQPAQVELAQMSPSELVTRLDRLENQIRQLTGQVEQLQFQLRRLQEGGGPGVRQEGSAAPMQPAPPMQPVRPAQPGAVPGPYTPPPRRSDAAEPNESFGSAARPVPRRPDVFDPNEDPTAPGAPRVLGTIPSGPHVIRGDPDEPNAAPPIGVPGGRQAGAPLDLSTMSANAANDPALPPPGGAGMGGALPPPPPRTPSATGSYQLQAAVPPATNPKDEYDLAYGYLVRKDYAVAEDNFRSFLRKYPNDRMVAEANYWVGESLFQRQRFREAAESFLTVSTKYEKSSKAPDALVRLGQSLAALKEKDAACATFVEVSRKYPRASPSVKQSVEREQKRAGC
jgi:tol-pal system protein YbgF